MPQKAIIQYEHYYEMLSDRIRMDAYKAAIDATVKPGDIVVDLGCGTGILGFWALKAGAKHVYAIDKSDAIDLARAVAKVNGFEDRVTFLQANSKDIELPQKADILVSETLGSFAVDESTLDFTCDARRRFLKPNGILIPCHLELFLAPVMSVKIRRKLDFWNTVDGIDFSPAHALFSEKIRIETIAKKDLLAQAQTYAEIDLYQSNDACLQNKLHFKIQKTATLHGLGGWFTAQLSADQSIHTTPGKPLTHWKHAFFPFKESIEVVANDVLEVDLQVRPKKADSDDTHITYHYRCTQLADASTIPGRNAPCHCGSGQKFKRCCGA